MITELGIISLRFLHKRLRDTTLLGRLKTREWTTWHGRKCRGGKRGSKWQR